jgi:transcriptional regulator GlxA family with amidase domain
MERLNRARQLLGWTSLSIKEIAAEVGYHDPFYFSARFRKHLGKSPRAFRAAGD